MHHVYVTSDSMMVGYSNHVLVTRCIHNFPGDLTAVQYLNACMEGSVGMRLHREEAVEARKYG